jgi:hypothetical protein
LVEDSADSPFRCNRAIFTDVGFFELEMKHLFEGNWVYLAHESQISNRNDYFTTWMGRQLIFIARNKDNELNAFINACSRRRAMLCRMPCSINACSVSSSLQTGQRTRSFAKSSAASRRGLHPMRLAPYKVPEGLEILDELPRNALSKGDRNRLQAMAAEADKAGRPRVAAAPSRSKQPDARPVRRRARIR